MKSKVLITAFFIFSFMNIYSSTNYSIKGEYQDGSLFSENDVFLINDQCLFSIVNPFLENIVFNTFTWSLQGLTVDSDYRIITEDNSSIDYNLQLDTTLITFRDFDSLERYALENDSSTYFIAKVCFNGETTGGDQVKLETPVFLNLLPGRAVYEVVNIDFLSIWEYMVGIECKADRIDGKYVIIQKEYLYYRGRLLSNTAFIGKFNGDYVYPIRVDLEMFTTFQLVVNNGFGEVRSSVLNVKEGMEEYLISNSSVEVNRNDGYLLYPNPVTDILNVSKENPEDDVSLSVYDVSGKLVKCFNQVGDFVNVKELNSGFYSVIITNNSDLKQSVFKLIKQ